MSGSANEAQVVISTDYQTMKDFVEFTQGGFDKIKKKGKESFQEIGKEVFDFTKSVVGGQFVSAGNEIASAITAPLKKGLSEAIKDAESFRKVIGGIAISTGGDAKAIGAEFDKLSSDTRRSIEEINGFIRGTKAITGDRKAAVAAVPGVSKEARLRGEEDMGALAGEVAHLQRMGVTDITRFYNEGRAEAKAVSVDPNRAMNLLGKMSPSLVNTGMAPEKARQWTTSLLHATDGDMPRAQAAGEEFIQFAQNRQARGYLENTLGLKQGALLDKNGYVDTARVWDLTEKFQATKRGKEKLGYIARQHMSPTLAHLWSSKTDLLRSDMTKQQQVPAGTDLEDSDKLDRESDLGKAEAAEQERRRKDREMGKDMLPWYDRAREQAGGWAGWAKGKVLAATGAIGAFGVRKSLVAAGLGTVGLAAGASTMRGDADYSPEATEKWKTERASQQIQDRKNDLERMQRGGLGGWFAQTIGRDTPEKAKADIASLEHQANMQGKATAEQLSRGASIPVRITNMGMAPTVGQGAQK